MTNRRVEALRLIDPFLDLRCRGRRAGEFLGLVDLLHLGRQVVGVAGAQLLDGVDARGLQELGELGLLGATIPEEDAWDLVRALRPNDETLPVVPAEITTGIGMYWLKHHGIITVNALGQPGARVSLRFKPDPDEIARFGGISAVVEAIDDGIQWIAERAGSVDDMKRVILGEA